MPVDPPANPSGSSVPTDLPTVSTESSDVSVVPSDASAVIDDDSTNTFASDQPVSSPAPPVGKNRSSSLSHQKPAPMPAALEALARRPTRPSLPVSGKTVPNPPPEADEMDAQSSLKRKQEISRKKGDQKKGKR